MSTVLQHGPDEVQRPAVRKRVPFGVTVALLTTAALTAPWHSTAVVQALPAFSGFAPGNLVVSRSVYSVAPTIVPTTQILPGSANATVFVGTGTTTGGTVLGNRSKSGKAQLKKNTLVQITTGGNTYVTTLTAVSADPFSVLTWAPALPTAVQDGDRIADVALALADGSYPGVWQNDTADASFGVTQPIYLDQLTPAGDSVNTLAIDPAQIVTSFSSKSELALNLSVDGKAITFMGYVAPLGKLDASNADTPLVIDPTNLVGLAPVARGIAQVNLDGTLHVTAVDAYSGNNGRAVLLAGGNYYMVGNAGNSGNGTTGATLSALSDNSGVQMITAGSSGATTVVGLAQGVFGDLIGYQRGFSIAQPPLNNPADKTGKDDNFRGLTLTRFNNTLVITKGSGSNGVDTVYQVGVSGVLPTLPQAAVTPIAILNGLPTGLAANITNDTPADAAATEFHPFGIWFANATTLYVADEGDGTLEDAGSAAHDPNAGLEKWTWDGSTWQLAYTLRNGLNLGTPYSVANGAHGEVYPTSLNPATGGLRNLTGRVNADGTVSIWAVTSTVSTNGDPGADPNQLVFVVDDLANTSAAAALSEPFKVLRTAGYGEVLRGVSYLAVPLTKDDCKDGVWPGLVRADGTPFKNQGACVSYINAGK